MPPSSPSDQNDRPKSASTLLSAIMRLSLPHWKMLALATFSLFVGSSIGLIYPQAARLVIDDVITSGKIYGYELSTVGLGLLVLFAFQAVFVSLRYYLFTVVGDRVVADLRQSLYKAILSQEIAFFDERKTGELTSRLSSDTQIIQSAVTTNLSMLLRYGVQILGGMGLLVYTSWRLSLVLLVVLPIVFVVALGYGRVVRRLSRQVQDAIAASTAVAEESIAGVRTVRSFSREAHEVGRYNSAIDHAFELARTRARFGAGFGGGMSFMSYGALAVVLWAGSSMVMDGTMTPGDLTAFLLYMIMVAFSLGVLSGLYTDFMKATGASERVFGLIEREPVRKRPTPADARTVMESGTLSFDEVTFRYPTRLDRIALDEVSFSVEPGRKVALVGHSGSGKSTVVSLISTFYEPDSGTILIDGHPLEDYASDVLRESVGLVAQEPLLFSGTVRENVLYGKPEASEEQVRAALRDAYALDFVEEFAEGLDTLIGERGVRLSGGQKQRIAIARAILKDPVILLLDEATSALDVESESVVQHALDALMTDRTTLIVAHRLSTIRSADHIVVLSKGRVMEQGTHEELMELQGHYARLIKGQFE